MVMEEMIIEIVRVTEEGKGVGFAPDGRTVIIDGVSQNDERVKVKVSYDGEVTIKAKKISSSTAVKKEKQTNETLKKNDNPYEIDDGLDDDDDEEDEY